MAVRTVSLSDQEGRRDDAVLNFDWRVSAARCRSTIGNRMPRLRFVAFVPARLGSVRVGADKYAGAHVEEALVDGSLC